ARRRGSGRRCHTRRNISVSRSDSERVSAGPAEAADSPDRIDSAPAATAAGSGIAAEPPASGADDAESVETIVHVLRHGEVHNPRGILYGRLPGFGLSVTGRAQAGAVARSLADHDIALVIASPLQRAQEPAEPIAGRHGLTVRIDEN